jgi:FtsZ-binding cell division protein ZapB
MVLVAFRPVFKMSDPVVNFQSNGVIEIVDGSTHHYLRRDVIQSIVHSPYRIGIFVYGRNEGLYLSFVDKKVMASVLANIITELSAAESPAISIRESLDSVKEAMEGVRQIQMDLTKSLMQVTAKLEDFKNDLQSKFKEELSKALHELSAEDHTLQERVKALEDYSQEDQEEEPDNIKTTELVPVMETSTTCEIFLTLVIILLSIIMISGGFYYNNKQ